MNINEFIGNAGLFNIDLYKAIESKNTEQVKQIVEDKYKDDDVVYQRLDKTELDIEIIYMELMQGSKEFESNSYLKHKL